MSADLRRAAHAKYQRERWHALKQGVTYTTSPDRARAHILMLLDAGFQQADIVRAADVGTVTIKNILASEGRIYTVTEERILGTTQATIAEHAKRVPTAVPTRMVRALTRLGWGVGEISRVSGLNTQTVRDIRDRPRPRIQRTTAELIGQAYDQMVGMSQPGGDYANDMRKYARRKGWAPPAEANDHWKEAA